MATRRFLCAAVLIALGHLSLHASTADDWPMLGRDASHNSVSSEKHPPIEWNIGEVDWQSKRWLRHKALNIKWAVQLGSQTQAAPVVADGQVYVGTNNGAGYVDRFPAETDLGCLLCFRESNGEFLWQFSAEKHPSGRIYDWPLQGLVASPLVEGDRMWFVSNRYDLLCLDTRGFRDGQNDGPFVDEPVTNAKEADIVWKIGLLDELKVRPHSAGMGPNRRCSVASYQDRIYVVTGNGVGEDQKTIPTPEAPSLACFNKVTGKLLWTDASPGTNILHCQLADPLVVEIGGHGQVIVPQGDGWVRSFDALSGELIWEFDINQKESKWVLGGQGTRNNILATPVFHQGRVFVASGQEAEHGEGAGRLVCIDPTKTGDISAELAVDQHGNSLPQRRIQAVNPEDGERAIPNPNSGLIWEFTQRDLDANGEIGFEETFHRTFASVAIKDNLLIAADFSGLIH